MLKIAGLHKSFGSAKVINDLSIEVKKGEIVGVVGPNGAGKSTLFNLIGGDLRSDAGTIFFLGREITRMPSYQRCHLGIGRTYQIPQPFRQLSVLENVLVGLSFGTAKTRSLLSTAGKDELAIDALSKTGLLDKSNQLAGSLTLLQRKKLELAKALSTSPSLLLLDEIAGGLTENESEQLIDVIKGIANGGVTIIWVEHVLHALLAVINRLFALDLGAVIIDGKPKAVMNSKQVKKIYMGVE